MAMPVLYWLLECTKCGARRVVRGTWLEAVRPPDIDPSGGWPIPGSEYGGQGLDERNRCLRCLGKVRKLASTFSAQSREMSDYDADGKYKSVHREMTQEEFEEWTALIGPDQAAVEEVHPVPVDGRMDVLGQLDRDPSERGRVRRRWLFIAVVIGLGAILAWIIARAG